MADEALVLLRESPLLLGVYFEITLFTWVDVEDELWIVQLPRQSEAIKSSIIKPTRTRCHFRHVLELRIADGFALLYFKEVLLVVIFVKFGIHTLKDAL
jgi:hypothetical protein